MRFGDGVASRPPSAAAAARARRAIRFSYSCAAAAVVGRGGKPRAGAFSEERREQNVGRGGRPVRCGRSASGRAQIGEVSVRDTEEAAADGRSAHAPRNRVRSAWAGQHRRGVTCWRVRSSRRVAVVFASSGFVTPLKNLTEILFMRIVQYGSLQTKGFLVAILLNCWSKDLCCKSTP